ncbi:GMC oxidoreductase [Pedobacter miscanthi]|uniref:GMC family oxidoreductase n=1 Tax=Pedobacter miscanthi TaxID=2259170 RepID=A0A366KPJ1_9SPHI|nr:GMC oxidoreductase [Pedobacter miscanthi]RBQ03565.1 hypothetical protein DRW42_21400 [Pedobacter miscanthi]
MKFDYVIVGSGLGGGVLASHLSSDKKIAVIEAGSENGNSDRVNHHSTGLDFRWPLTRSIEKGGTSNLWHGVLSPLDEIDFKERSWIPGSGWPIKKEDLDPYYDKAAEFLKVNNSKLFIDSVSNKEFQSDLEKIHISEGFKFKYFQQPTPPLRTKTLLNKLADNVTVYTDTVALELIPFEDQPNKIRCVKCYCEKKKEFIEIEGNEIIVAAGALETPRLLLNSTTCGFYSNKNIGRYLMDHPMGNFLQIKFKVPTVAPVFTDTLHSPNNKIKVGMVLDEMIQERHKFPNHNFFIRPSFKEGLDAKTELVKLSLLAVRNNKVSFRDIINILSNLNLARQILTYKLSLKVKLQLADLFLLTEQTPYEQSQVKLSPDLDRYGYRKAEVNWQLNDYDKENIIRYIQFVFNNCFSKDEIKFTVNPEDVDWDKTFTSAAHHVGTARMAASEANGVVDKNLQVFNTQNLFIADGSVFTTSGNVNSGFTIISLAIRLSNYLNGKEN